MPNVVCILEEQEHTSLKGLAKENRRTLGRQLVAMAFQVGGLITKPTKPAKKKGAKSSV